MYCLAKHKIVLLSLNNLLTMMFRTKRHHEVTLYNKCLLSANIHSYFLNNKYFCSETIIHITMFRHSLSSYAGIEIKFIKNIWIFLNHCWWFYLYLNDIARNLINSCIYGLVCPKSFHGPYNLFCSQWFLPIQFLDSTAYMIIF